jgi:hypothetical protein
MDNNVLVFSILGVAFVAVGVHLILYARRVSRRLRRYADSHGLIWHARDREDLESQINETFDLPETGLVQNFGRVRDVIRFDAGTLFRATELLDLTPHGSATNPHSSRVAVLFDLAGAPEGIFMVSPSLEVRQRYPLEGRDETQRVAGLFRSPGVPAPPHPLALSLRDGRALAYLEPLVAGSVSDSDLDYLMRLARGLPGSPA